MNQNPNQKKKIEYRKKPDYLIMLFTLIIVIGVFLFLRDALEGEVANLNITEMTQAAEAGHIQKIEYTPVGGDNITLVQITGTFYANSGSANFYETVNFEGIMPLEYAQDIFLTVEAEGGTTSIKARSGVTIWTVLINLVPMILVLVILFIIFRNANNQNSKDNK